MKVIVDGAGKEKRRKKRGLELILGMPCRQDIGKRIERMQTRSMMCGCGEGTKDVHP